MLLKLVKENGHIRNLNEWDTSLRNAFVAAHLVYNIQPQSSIQIPSEYVNTLIIQRQLDEHMMLERKSARTVKTEKNFSEQKNSRQSPSSQGVWDPKEIRTSPVGALSDSDRKDFEKIVRKRTEKIAEDIAKSNLLREGRGTKKVTLFASPFTSVDACDAHLNPMAKYEITIEKVTRLYAAEDVMIQQKRLYAWQLMTDSIGVITKNLYRHIAVGNCYELYKWIMETHEEGE